MNVTSINTAYSQNSAALKSGKARSNQQNFGYITQESQKLLMDICKRNPLDMETFGDKLLALFKRADGVKDVITSVSEKRRDNYVFSNSMGNKEVSFSLFTRDFKSLFRMLESSVSASERSSLEAAEKIKK